MKRLFALGAVSACLLLSGCVTQLPDNEYQLIANRVSAASVCKREQLITADQFNNYASFQTQTYPGQFQYDAQKLGSVVESTMGLAASAPVTDADRAKVELVCANIATVADRVRPAGQPVYVPQAPVYTPQTTNCITNYGYTTCSSY